jgi:F0F1-type ATP synthase membrane subunit b/b'
MAGDTLDVGIKLQLADLQKQLAQIPGMTAAEAKLMVAELNKSVKLAEKAASTAAKGAGGTTKKVVDEVKKATEEFGKSARGVGENTAKLGGLLGQVNPQFGQAAQFLGQFAGAGGVAADAAAELGTTVGGLAATLGPLVVVVAALSAAYVVQKREVDRLIEARQFEHDIAKSLLPAERALEDAKRAEAVATGELTEAEGAEVAIRQKAQRAILDYFEAQKKSREELNETIESSKKYIAVQRGLAAALAISFDLTAGLAATNERMRQSGKSLYETIKGDIVALDGMMDSVTGLESGAEGAKGKIKALDQAVRDEASAQKGAKDATIAADRATRAKTAGDKAAADAIRDQTKALDAAKEAQKALNDAVEGIGKTGAQKAFDATIAKLGEEQAALKAVGQLTDENRAKFAAAYTDAAALLSKGLADEEKARQALRDRAQGIVDQATAGERDAYQKLVDDKKKALADYLDAAQAAGLSEQKIAAGTAQIAIGYAKKEAEVRRAENAKTRDELTKLAADGLSKVADLTAQASAKNAAVATALQDQLIAGQGIYTAAQGAALKKRIASARAAALREFQISKALSIATATINVAEGVSKALAGPLPLIRAGVVAAAGGAQIAAIAAQQPAFHSGGVFDPDEGSATLRRGEYVVPPVARTVLGDDTLRKASAGVSSPSSTVYAIQVYGHSHIVDRYETDRLRVGGPLSVAIKKGSRPGMGGL